MKKIVLIVAALSMFLVAALPALAEDNQRHNDPITQRDLNQLENQLQKELNQLDDEGFSSEPFFNQTNDQDVESGDSTQVFTVTGGGDNSNQCVGLQGVSNTGNQVTNDAVQQYGGSGDVGIRNGDFIISPVNTTTCDQTVDQTAVATG